MQTPIFLAFFAIGYVVFSFSLQSRKSPFRENKVYRIGGLDIIDISSRESRLDKYGRNILDMKYRNRFKDAVLEWAWYPNRRFDSLAISSYGKVNISTSDYAFLNNFNISSLDLSHLSPYSCNIDTIDIPEKAFSNNKTLQRIVLPDRLSFIDYGAFSNCKELREIILLSPPPQISYVPDMYNNENFSIYVKKCYFDQYCNNDDWKSLGIAIKVL